MMDTLVLFVCSLTAFAIVLCNFFQATEPEGPFRILLVLNFTLLADLPIVWLAAPNVTDTIWCAIVGFVLIASMVDLISQRMRPTKGILTRSEPTRLLSPGIGTTPIRSSSIFTVAAERW